MIFIERVIGRQFMQQYHQTVFSLLIQLDSYLRRLIPKYSRIPRKYEFFWALNFQILTCVNEDASVLGLRINPKGSPITGLSSICTTSESPGRIQRRKLSGLSHMSKTSSRDAGSTLDNLS